MATFAVYLTAAMMRLEPPTDWNDIVELALKQMPSTRKGNYCKKQLHKALEVGLRFGIIKKLNDRYYLYEYAKIDEEGSVSYDFVNNTLGKFLDPGLPVEDSAKDQSLGNTHTNWKTSDIATTSRRVDSKADKILGDLLEMDVNLNQTKCIETINIQCERENEGVSDEITNGNAVENQLKTIAVVTGISNVNGNDNAIGNAYDTNIMKLVFSFPKKRKLMSNWDRNAKRIKTD